MHNRHNWTLKFFLSQKTVCSWLSCFWSAFCRLCRPNADRADHSDQKQIVESRPQRPKADCADQKQVPWDLDHADQKQLPTRSTHPDSAQTECSSRPPRMKADQMQTKCGLFNLIGMYMHTIGICSNVTDYMRYFVAAIQLLTAYIFMHMWLENPRTEICTRSCQQLQLRLYTKNFPHASI